MRDYSKISPQFWHGKTGKALKAQGGDTLLVAMYLLTCRHANMLGLYSLNKMYISIDTGIPFEGACEGLQRAIEAGFCRYDEDSEVVWVMEMASFQIAKQLAEKDNQVKGVQREYDAVPENPFLSEFYDKYGQAFHMVNRRGKPPKNNSPSEGASKPLRSQEQEQEQEQDKKAAACAAGKQKIQSGWLPRNPAIQLLVENGVAESFIDDCIPEFVLYWSGRGVQADNWDSRFVKHVSAQWETFTLEAAHKCRVIADDFYPSPMCFDLFRLANIPEEFAKAEIPEFILYWQERGVALATWNTKFIQHVKFKWASRRQSEIPKAESMLATIARMQDRSWAMN